MKDPETAEALKPWYRQFCKRPCFHDEYLQTFNRPNVTLVDTRGRGVERLTETAWSPTVSEYEVDCLIFATGFEVGTGYTRRAGYDIYRPRRPDACRRTGPTACGPCTGSPPTAFPTASSWDSPRPRSPSACRRPWASRPITWPTSSPRRATAAPGIVEPTAEAEEAYVEEVHSLARLGERFYRECTPGYYNGEGSGRGGFFSDMYGAGPLKFFENSPPGGRTASSQGMALR